MKSEQIADKRRIFELFTTILDLVAGYDERQVQRKWTPVCACGGTVYAR